MSVSFVGAGDVGFGSGNFSITAPAGIASGDVVIISVGATVSTSIGWPSGFTQQLSFAASNSSDGSTFVATKLAGGSEPSSYSITNSGGTGGTCMIYVLRGLSSATPANTETTTHSGLVTSLTQNALTSGTTDATVYSYGGTGSAGGLTITTPGTLSNSHSYGAGNFYPSAIAWGTNVTSPGAGTASGSGVDLMDWGLDFTSGPTAPAAPTGVSAVAGNASATVSWTAPNNGGSVITSYTVTPYIGVTAQTTTTVAGSPPVTNVTVTGLTNGTTYTFIVSATNSVGTGPNSSASNAVTPAGGLSPAVGGSSFNLALITGGGPI